jgi:hypothetical protein
MSQDVKIVIGAGAGGGLVSWAYTIITGATFGLSNWTALPLCIILGTAAAIVAVYVITPTDVTKTGQLIGYAVLCGFLWKPVLDAGRIVINQRIETGRTAEQLKEQVNELKTTAAAPAAVGENANEAAGHAAELLRTSEQLGNPNLEKQAATQATETVDVIADKASVNPAAATLALSEIKMAAEDSGNSDVAQFATEKIQMIQRTFPVDLVPSTPPPNQ